MVKQGRVDGKVVVVTGAASGLGRATAIRLAGEGARLVVTDGDTRGLSATAEQLGEVGGVVAGVVSIPGDITEERTPAAVIAAAMETFGAVHGLCNVAGTLGAGGPLETCTVTEFDRVMSINCRAQMVFMRDAIPALKHSGGGSIVNVASVGALVALPMMAAYCASKAAVLGLTRAAALELAPDVRCNAICPGGIDTPMAQTFLAQFPDKEEMLGKLVGRQLLKRFATPEEVAELLLFLISDESAFITGAVLPIEAGHTTW